MSTDIAFLIEKIRKLPQITLTTPTARILLEEIVAALKEWQLERKAKPFAGPAQSDAPILDLI